MAKLACLLAVPHDPTLPAAVARGGEAPPPIQEAAALIEAQRAVLAQSQAESLVIVAGDHLNQWFLNNMPPFLIGKAGRSQGPFEDEVRVFGIESLDVPSDAQLARRLLAGGYERGIDFAYSDEYTLDHAFTVPLLFVRPQRDLPVVPVFTNILAPPLPTARRFFDVGVAIRETIDAWQEDRRVAVIVTGHMTNNMGGPRMLDFVSTPESEWDRRTWQLIEEWDIETLIEESTFEKLNRAGHATPAFLDFILAFGLAGGPPSSARLIASPAAPALAFFTWTKDAL